MINKKERKKERKKEDNERNGKTKMKNDDLKMNETKIYSLIIMPIDFIKKALHFTFSAHACAHTHTHTLTCTNAHTLTHTHTNTHIYTHTHTHTHYPECLCISAKKLYFSNLTIVFLFFCFVARINMSSKSIGKEWTMWVQTNTSILGKCLYKKKK